MSETIYTPELAKQLPAMFDNGETVKEVCVQLGITPETFEEWKSKYPEFNESAEIGELNSECFYEDLLYKAALGEVDKDFDIDGLMGLMQQRFPETYGN